MTSLLDSILVVVPLNRSVDPSQRNFHVSSSDWVVIEGAVVGYFRESSVRDISGGGVSFATESTSSNRNDFFGYNAGIAATGTKNSFFGYAAGWGAVSGDNSGDNNAFFGDVTGYNNSTGSKNAFLAPVQVIPTLQVTTTLFSVPKRVIKALSGVTIRFLVQKPDSATRMLTRTVFSDTWLARVLTVNLILDVLQVVVIRFSEQRQVSKLGRVLEIHSLVMKRVTTTTET
jgi:hypothetical protein